MEKEENQPRYEADDLREAVEVLKKGGIILLSLIHI